MITDKINFGVRGHDISADGLSELSQKLKSYGITSVQLVLKKSCNGFREGMFSPAFANKIGKTFEENGVNIAILGCYINPSCTNEEALKAEMNYFVESLKYARYMNAGVVGLETGFIGDTCDKERNNTEEAYQHLFKNMSVLRDAAEKLGVTIAVEGVSFFVINSPERMHRLITELNSPNMAVIFDPLNLITMENYESQEELFEKMFSLLGEKIVAIHLKDFELTDGGIRQCPLGKGIMNIPLLLSIIRERKPNIPVILEEVKEDDLVRSLEYLNGI